MTRCLLCGTQHGSFDDVEHQPVRGHARELAAQRFTVWRCAHCRSLHSVEPVDLDALYARYPLRTHQLDFVMRMSYRNRLALLIRAGLRRDHRILDYGCGAGLFVQYLRSRGYEHADGYDRYIEAYRDDRVVRRGNDFVTAYDVIEHFEDPAACMRELRDASVPDGRIVIGTPDGGRVELDRQEHYMVELSQPYHRHILSESALTQLAANFHCQLIDVSHRFYVDTLVPFVNTRFAWAYLRKMGNHLDVVADGLQLSHVVTSPRLLFLGLFGYFIPVRANLTATFQYTPPNL